MSEFNDLKRAIEQKQHDEEMQKANKSKQDFKEFEDERAYLQSHKALILDVLRSLFLTLWPSENAERAVGSYGFMCKMSCPSIDIGVMPVYKSNKFEVGCAVPYKHGRPGDSPRYVFQGETIMVNPTRESLVAGLNKVVLKYSEDLGIKL